MVFQGGLVLDLFHLPQDGFVFPVLHPLHLRNRSNLYLRYPIAGLDDSSLPQPNLPKQVVARPLALPMAEHCQCLS